MGCDFERCLAAEDGINTYMMNSELKPSLIITGGNGLVGRGMLGELRNFICVAPSHATLDLTQADQVRLFFNQQRSAWGCIHLAGYTKVADSELERGNEQGQVYRLNVEATGNVAEACKKNGIPLVFFSTNYADATKFLDEETSWYGQTKLKAEEMVMSSGAEYSIWRIGFPFGYRREGKADWIHRIAERLKGNNLPTQFNDQKISPVFIPDLARSLESFMRKPKWNSHYDLSQDEVLTPYQAALEIADRLGFTGAVEEGRLIDYLELRPEAKRIYPVDGRLDNSTFKLEHNFEFTPWKVALEKALVGMSISM